MKQRALNRCGSCGHKWKPKGTSLSTHCPNCNSTDTRYDIKKEFGEEEEQAETKRDVFPEGSFGSVGGSSPIAPIGAPPHIAHPNHTAQHASTRATQRKKTKTPKKSILPVVVLLVLLVAMVAGLVYLQSPQWAVRKEVYKNQDCETILERYAFSKRKARRNRKKWQKWVVHWRQKAHERGCPAR